MKSTIVLVAHSIVIVIRLRSYSRCVISLWHLNLSKLHKATEPTHMRFRSKRSFHLINSIDILYSVFFSSFSSGGFQLSPDFRQRASSNASSVGRLSPIPSVVDLEPSWSYASLTQDFDNTTNSIRCNNLNQGDSVCMNQNNALDQLAGSLADDLTLQNEFLQGWVAATFFNSLVSNVIDPETEIVGL